MSKKSKKPISINQEKRLKSKYYKNEYDLAKRDFKKRKGYKIAIGFEDSPEFKRVKRNERRALNRLKKKEIQNVTGRGRGIGGSQITSRDIRITDDKQNFFWTLLGGDGDAIYAWREAEQAGGKIPGVTLFGVVIDYDENRKTYSSEFYFARAISKLAKQAGRLQQRVTVREVDEKTGKTVSKRKTIYYPQVRITILTDSNGIVYVIVKGEKDAKGVSNSVQGYADE